MPGNRTMRARRMGDPVTFAGLAALAVGAAATLGGLAAAGWAVFVDEEMT